MLVLIVDLEFDEHVHEASDLDESHGPLMVHNTYVPVSACHRGHCGPYVGSRRQSARSGFVEVRVLLAT